MLTVKILEKLHQCCFAMICTIDNLHKLSKNSTICMTFVAIDFRHHFLSLLFCLLPLYYLITQVESIGPSIFKHKFILRLIKPNQIYMHGAVTWVIRLNPYPFSGRMKKIYPPFIFDFVFPILHF